MVVSLSCLVSCGSDPLDSCLKETDGTLDCSFAEFNNVDLSGRDLRNVDLFGTLHGTDLSQANLSGVDLSFNYLKDTDFSGANLEGVDFSESILEWVDFSGANLYGTDFSTWEFTGAKADDETVWPEGVDPEAAGVIFED